MTTRWTFLGHVELANVRELRKSGQLADAEAILLSGEPSEAVLDELRKTYSAMARISRRAKDWEAVIRHLEAYESYAHEWAWYCRKMVNAEPPSLSETDKRILDEAKTKIAAS